jgi:Protein of unknown function (DUF3667)
MMTDGIEGVGEAVTGGMIARTAEPQAGEAGADGHTHEANCLNCRAELVGSHCHQCGQKAHVHRTLGAFWHDLLHGVFHFEGKIWRTLPMLAWRPGELTRRYIAGERSRFVSPIALFLFSVFLMFAVFSTVGGPFSFQRNPEAIARMRAEADRNFAAERALVQAEIDRLGAERGRLAADRRSTAEIEARLGLAQERLRTAEETHRTAVRLIEGGNSGPAAGMSDDSGRIDFQVTQRPSGIAWLDRAALKAFENPSLTVYKLQNNAYKFSWALIPISVPFVWLLFLNRARYRRRYGAYDHVVFVTYSIAFMSFGLIALGLLRPLGVGETLIGLVILLVPPVHMYRQLRGAYSLSWPSTLWRTAILVFLALSAATIFLLMLLVLGLLS